MNNPSEKWPDITGITFATPEDAKKMAEILNDVFIKLEFLRKEVLELRQLSHHNNWSVGPMG